jgi:hypothetical protein
VWNDATDGRIEQKQWNYYEAVNQKYADLIVEEYQTGDIIWIHDYHLLLVPNMVRAKLPKARIGLFVHSPFPSSELFRCLPSKCPFFFLSFFTYMIIIRTSRDLKRDVGCEFGWISSNTQLFFFITK